MEPLWRELCGTLSQTEANFPPRGNGFRIQCKTEGLGTKVGSASSTPKFGRWERKCSTILPLA